MQEVTQKLKIKVHSFVLRQRQFPIKCLIIQHTVLLWITEDIQSNVNGTGRSFRRTCVQAQTLEHMYKEREQVFKDDYTS